MHIPEPFGPDVYFDIRIPRDGQYGLFFETVTSQSYLMIKLYLDIRPLSLSVRQPSPSTEFYEITWPEEVVPVSPLAVIHIPPSHGELEKEVVHSSQKSFWNLNFDRGMDIKNHSLSACKQAIRDGDNYSRVTKFSAPMIVQALFTKIPRSPAGPTATPVLLSMFVGFGESESLFDSPYEFPLLKNDPIKAFELGSGKIRSDGAEYRVSLSLNDGMNAFSNSCVKVSAKVTRIMVHPFRLYCVYAMS